MASVTVDVSLDEFDLDELLEEVEDRYNYKKSRDKEQIEEWAKDLFEIERFDVQLSLLDQMKIDLLMRNLDKITLNDLEKLIYHHEEPFTSSSVYAQYKISEELFGKRGDESSYPTWAINKPLLNYYNSFELLLRSMKNPRIIEIANIYYLTKNIKDIYDNLEEYSKTFESANSDKVYRPLSPISESKFSFFENRIRLSHLSIAPLTMPPVNDEPTQTQDQYKQLRKIGMEFIDRQVFRINNFLALVNEAVSQATYTQNASLSKLKILKQNVNNIISQLTLQGGGTCKQLNQKTYSILQSGLFDKIPIPQLLSNLKENSDKRQKFLDEIKFTKIENFEQLLDFYRQNMTVLPRDNSNRLTLFKKAVLAKIAKNGSINGIPLYYDNNFRDAGNPPNPIANDHLLINVPAANYLDEYYDKTTFDLSTVPRQGIQLKNIKFDYGNFLMTTDGIRPVQDFINACEVDGNVGAGEIAIKNVSDALKSLLTFGLEQVLQTGLDLFILQETTAGRINDQRIIPKEIFKTLYNYGFIPEDDYDIFSVCRTLDKYSSVYSFLECKSKKFASIPYEAQTIFNGIRKNCREVFVELFAEELKKTSPFRNLEEFKGSQPILKDYKDEPIDIKREEIILKGLALQFNLNIIVFSNSPLTITEIKPDPTRYGIEDIYMFRDSNNIHYPIVLQQPPLRNTLKKDKYDLSRFMGGAIDSPPLTFADKGTFSFS
jgi:hypothetical protein